jgi:hypothetical protein
VSLYSLTLNSRTFPPVGNLPYAVDEESLQKALQKCGMFLISICHLPLFACLFKNVCIELAGKIIKTTWITDKGTGKFYGSAFAGTTHAYLSHVYWPLSS